MLQNPHARSHPVWGTLSHHYCMHCHSKHAVQHSQQVLSVCESRDFCSMELLPPHLWWWAQELSISIMPVELSPAASR